MKTSDSLLLGDVCAVRSGMYVAGLAFILSGVLGLALALPNNGLSFLMGSGTLVAAGVFSAVCRRLPRSGAHGGR